MFLALLVAFDHFWGLVIQPRALVVPLDFKLGMNAGFAVMFFYVVSGFLISFALSHKYAPTRSGTVAFYRGRFARIFSLYWPVVLIAMIVYAPARAWLLDAPVLDRLAGLGLIGLDWMVSYGAYPNLTVAAAVPGIEPAWTLGSELTFYLLAPVLLRSWKLVVAVVLCSATVRAVALTSVGFHPVWHYTALPGTIIFFLIGHLVRVLSARFSILLDVRLATAALGLAVIASAMTPTRLWDGASFWLVVLLFAASVPGMFDAFKGVRWLNFLGDLSFPVYLIHMLVIKTVFIVHADAVLRMLTPDPIWAGIGITILYLGSVMVIATAAHLLIERPIERIARGAVPTAGGKTAVA